MTEQIFKVITWADAVVTPGPGILDKNEETPIEEDLGITDPDSSQEGEDE